MASPNPTPTRTNRLCILDPIEIHQDAIIDTQSNAKASATTGLETDLAEMKLDRMPLGEINLHNAQDIAGSGEDYETVRQSQECEFVGLSEGRVRDSETSEPFILSHHDTKPAHVEASIATNHINRLKAIGTSLSPSTAARQSLGSLTTKSTSHSLARHTASPTIPRSRTTASSELPIIEISKRQQGQGEHIKISQLQKQTIDNTTTATPKAVNPVFAIMSSPLAMRSVSNKENWEPFITPIRTSPSYDILEAAVVDAATPPTSQSRPQSSGHVSSENGIPELDESAVDAPSQEMPAPSIASLEIANASASEEKVEAKVQPRVKKTPLVRTTKASQARISLAHDPKSTPRAPAWGRPRESVGRSSSLRHSIVAQRNASGASASSSDEEKKQQIVIPHSKPRPMSMSFPTPPPPPKSTKAPTLSTFALPGDAVAAKLKAARQEREKKDNGPKVFKARPVPTTTKNAPAVRQTNTSRARESLGGKDLAIAPAHRRASSVAYVRPADKHQSISIRPTSRDKLTTAATIKELSTDRPSTSLANISKPRIASPADVARPTQIKAPSGVKTVKGREVFSRSAFANDTAEREKRSKEEATRKARAEAAERSRQLSREWAEKKRREKNAKPKVKVEQAA